MAGKAAETSIERPYGWLVVIASMAMVSMAFGAMCLIVVGMAPVSQEMGWPRSVPSLAASCVLAGSYRIAFLTGVCFNLANPVIVLGLAFRWRPAAFAVPGAGQMKAVVASQHRCK